MSSIDDQAQLPADRITDVAEAMLNLVAEVAALSVRVSALEAAHGSKGSVAASAASTLGDEVVELVRRVLAPFAQSER